MRGRLWRRLIAVFIVVMVSSPAYGSLASIGYTVLRWLDRAEIIHHDLSIEVDPARFEAHFVDKVTFLSSGSRHINVLLGNDVSLERVSDDEGRELEFSPTLSWGTLPFTIYRVEAPPAPKGELFQLRFEWRITQESVRLINPFVSLRFFYVGYASLWYPHMPNEEYFEADIAVTVPSGYTAVADGDLRFVETLPDGRERLHFRTPAPVSALGVGVGRFRALEPVAVGAVTVQGWQPVGWSSSAAQVTQYAAAAISYFTDRLGPLPIDRFFVAEVPFSAGMSYASLYGLVYGGDLSPAGIAGETGLAFFAAHEAAHKWIGGLASTRIVGGAWLSEGLAEYLGYLALESIHGRDAALSLLKERTYEPFVQRMQRRHRALDAIELFDSDHQLIYEKGALVFRMLHRRLGDDAFYGLIRRWVEAYRGDFSTGDDFIRLATAFVESLPASSSSEHAGEPAPGQQLVRRGAGGTTPREIRAFLEHWIKGTLTLDYALEVLEAGEKRLRARVVSKGRLVEPGPVSLLVHLEDGRVYIAQLPLDEIVELALPSRPVAAVLDHEMWLADVNPDNNRWQISPL